jgi:hypothetical protein
MPDAGVGLFFQKKKKKKKKKEECCFSSSLLSPVLCVPSFSGQSLFVFVLSTRLFFAVHRTKMASHTPDHIDLVALCIHHDAPKSAKYTEAHGVGVGFLRP